MSDENFITIYTDGACQGNGNANAVGGWAFICINNEGQNYVRYGGEVGTTNNKMELTAVAEALEYFTTIADLENKLEIVSDSKYVIDCLTKKWYKKWVLNGWKTATGAEVKNPELWQKILDLIENKIGKETINFKWVKGHNGNVFNEVADRLAVKGLEEAKKERIKNE